MKLYEKLIRKSLITLNLYRENELNPNMINGNYDALINDPKNDFYTKVMITDAQYFLLKYMTQVNQYLTIIRAYDAREYHYKRTMFGHRRIRNFNAFSYNRPAEEMLDNEFKKFGQDLEYQYDQSDIDLYEKLMNPADRQVYDALKFFDFLDVSFFDSIAISSRYNRLMKDSVCFEDPDNRIKQIKENYNLIMSNKNGIRVLKDYNRKVKKYIYEDDLVINKKKSNGYALKNSSRDIGTEAIANTVRFLGWFIWGIIGLFLIVGTIIILCY